MRRLTAPPRPPNIEPAPETRGAIIRPRSFINTRSRAPVPEMVPRHHQPTRVGPIWPIPSAAMRISVRYDLTKQAIPLIRVRSSVLHLPLRLRPSRRIPAPVSGLRIPRAPVTPGPGRVMPIASPRGNPRTVEPGGTRPRPPLPVVGAPAPRVAPRMALLPAISALQGQHPLRRRARRLGPAPIVAVRARPRRVVTTGRVITLPACARQGRVGRPVAPGAGPRRPSSGAHIEATTPRVGP